MQKEQTKDYINEQFPKKNYKYSIRPRKPGEIFIGEILFALFLIFMLLMLFLNYQANFKYVTGSNQANSNQTNNDNSKINIEIEVQKESNFQNLKINSHSFLFVSGC